MSKFKVGDMVKILEDNLSGFYKKGHIGKITLIGINEVGAGIDDCVWLDKNELGGAWTSFDEIKLIKKGEPMSLRNRIEALDDGWNKEADDILQEIISGFGETKTFHIEIWVNSNSNSGGMCLKDCYGKVLFPLKKHDSQCERNDRFKEILLWLLDKSGLERHKKGDTIKIESEGKTYKVKIIEEVE